MEKNAKAMKPKLSVEKITKEQKENMKKIHEEEKGFLTLNEQRPHVKAIRNAIRNEERRLRKKHAWLAYQDAIGLGCVLFSLIGWALAAHLYLQGTLHWSLTIMVIMFVGSIQHEMEHDLIHNLYFSKYPIIQNALMLVIYIQKFHISPWYRKKLHLRHHIVSGQKEDIEERLIGLGRPFDWRRILVAMNHSGQAVFNDEDAIPQIAKDSEKDFEDHGFNLMNIVMSTTPTLGVTTVLFHVWLGYLRLTNGLTLGAYDPVNLLPLSLFKYVHAFAVLVALPNYLRNLCLNMCATYCHYFADIPENSVFYQNQILDHWALFPLHIFCFNFGATHILHHYVPAQPFYLRQMCFARTKKVLVEHGTRLNDMDIVRRRNRFYEYKNEHEVNHA